MNDTRMAQKYLSLVLLCSMLVMITGCQASTPVCVGQTGTPDYLSLAPDQLPTPTPGSGPYLAMIGKSQVQVDKIVQGALCNDTWQGTVYVTCDVQVYPWVENPTFLKECQLNIDPQAVVYVAYHNNTAYFKGCACHTGETPQP